jgi:signal transduction histidine kinase
MRNRSHIPFRSRLLFQANRLVVCGLTAFAMTTASEVGADSPLPLTNATQVRLLRHDEAAQALPVRLTGVVVGDAEPEGRGFVIWDGTESIYLLGESNLVSSLTRGDKVEIEGYSDPGGFAPFVQLERLKKIGAGQIPLPLDVTYENLIAGHLDAQWVRISGIVRSCEPWEEDPRKTKMVIASGGGTLATQVNTNLDAGELVDAVVSLEAICFNRHNMTRQFLSPLLLVPRGVGVQIDSPPPAQPFDTPTSSVASLLQFAPQGAYGHRVHVRGIVTHQRLGQFFWIRDNDRGLRVESHQHDILQVGDEVDVLGFPSRGDYTPIMEDGVFRKRARQASTPTPAVYVTNILDVLRHDADLIEFDARLTDRRLSQDGLTLTLEWVEGPVKASLPLPSKLYMPDWRPGSRVRATGICVVDPTETAPMSGVWEPHSFQLLLRSEADFKVIQLPPWWTHERMIWTLGTIAGTSMLMVAGVIFAARSRLKQQLLRRAMAEAEFSAILKERNRMAREIHDTLAQGLGAISMQLELAKGEINGGHDSVKRHLETAHGLVRSSLNDARTSIWNMRSQVLETGDLVGALTAILHQLTDGAGVEAKMDVTGRPRRLPPVVENDLLRIGQEAITNATKHARAKHIHVTLEYTTKQVSLAVIDNGQGFDATRPPQGEGRFGLVGMKERAVEMRGDILVESSPGKGTTITLTVISPEEQPLEP